MINRIEMSNWRTHRHTKLGFQKGVNVLIGIMGAGKSSTMDAISYALFGNFPALNSGRTNTESLISNRPARQDEASVSLSFEAGGSEYMVSRKISKKGSSARLEKNGEYLQSQPTKVTEEIEGILKVDYDTFARAIYSEQNRLEYFLELRGGERKKQIDRMLGLDSFATAEANATSLVNAVKSEIKYEEEALSKSDIKLKRQQLVELHGVVEALGKARDELGKKEKRLKLEAEEAKSRLEVQNREKQRKEALAREIEALSTRVKTRKDDIVKIGKEVDGDGKEVEDSYRKIEEEQKSAAALLAGLKGEESTSQKKFAALDAEVKQCKEKLREREKIIVEIKGGNEDSVGKELQVERERHQELLGEMAAKSGRLSEVNDAIRELSKHVSECPVCERELGPELKEKLLEGKKRAAEAAQGAIKSAQKAAEEKASRIKTLQALHDKLVLLNKRLSEFKELDRQLEDGEKATVEAAGALESASKEIKVLEKRIDAAREEAGRLKIKLQALERKKEYQKEVEKNETLLEQKNKEYSGIKVDEVVLEKLGQEWNAKSKELGSISSEIKGSAEKAEMLAKQEREKETEIKGLDEMDRRIARRKEQLTNLNKFKSALLDTEATLRARLVGSINAMMQGLWPKLYPYGDYAGLRINATADDYVLEFRPNSGSASDWIEVDGTASGGERSIAALAMRIAMGMVIVPNLRWLILDEPTHNVDAAGIGKLIDVLGTTLPQIVDQIFIITHDESLRQISSARVYQFDRDKEKNAPTLVSEL